MGVSVSVVAGSKRKAEAMVLDSSWEEKRLRTKKALHAAMIKCRFANTIFQARQKIKTEKADDPMKINQEKKTFQRKLSS
ncbi:hypothetical protein V6N13_041666 [Hibiscus sabdariffa]